MSTKHGSGCYQVGKVILVNPGDREVWGRRFVLAFGAYGDTLLLAYADSLDSALDECVDWIEEHAPGLLCDESVNEEYQAAIAEGASEEEAYERSTVDTTCAGNHGRYLLSWEWGIVAENPTRAELISLAGGAK